MVKGEGTVIPFGERMYDFRGSLPASHSGDSSHFRMMYITFSGSTVAKTRHSLALLATILLVSCLGDVCREGEVRDHPLRAQQERHEEDRRVSAPHYPKSLRQHNL